MKAMPEIETEGKGDTQLSERRGGEKKKDFRTGTPIIHLTCELGVELPKKGGGRPRKSKRPDFKGRKL